MTVLGQSCFEYLEKKVKLFIRKLSNIMYYTIFCKNTLHHVKTTILYLYFEQELHGNEMFYQTCVRLGDIFWQ